MSAIESARELPVRQSDVSKPLAVGLVGSNCGSTIVQHESLPQCHRYTSNFLFQLPASPLIALLVVCRAYLQGCLPSRWTSLNPRSPASRSTKPLRLPRPRQQRYPPAVSYLQPATGQCRRVLRENSGPASSTRSLRVYSTSFLVWQYQRKSFLSRYCSALGYIAAPCTGHAFPRCNPMSDARAGQLGSFHCPSSCRQPEDSKGGAQDSSM